MHVINISSNNSFRSIKLTQPLEQKLNLKTTSGKLINNVNEAKSLLKSVGLHNKKHVDVILNDDIYTQKVYAIISSKKQGVPMNFAYRHGIPNKTDKVGLKDLIEWVTTWDYLFSPKGLEEKNNIENKLKKTLKKLYN